MVRLLLLGLLPIIAVILFLEGQEYDSALIDFQPSARTSSTALFPRVIDGFNRSGQIQLYTPENLYEYVNGHAEYFLDAGFMNLWVGEYLKTDSDPDRPEVVVEIYDMGKDIQAFGVLVDEAGDNSLDPDRDGMAFESSQGLSFAAGRHYIKIDVFDKNTSAKGFLHEIKKRVGETSDFGSLFSRFPDLGTVVRTRYIKEAYRGLGFVRNVMEREYSINGTKVQVLLATGDPKKVRDLTASFMKYFGDSDFQYESLESKGNRYYKIMDPYEGDWYLVPRDDTLFGIYGATDSGLLEPFLNNAGSLGSARNH